MNNMKSNFNFYVFVLFTNITKKYVLNLWDVKIIFSALSNRNSVIIYILLPHKVSVFPN